MLNIASVAESKAFLETPPVDVIKDVPDIKSEIYQFFTKIHGFWRFYM